MHLKTPLHSLVLVHDYSRSILQITFLVITRLVGIVTEPSLRVASMKS